MQVQHSLIDRRPEKFGLVSLCEEHHVHILAYGVLAGGFLTDNWLHKQQPKVEVKITIQANVQFLISKYA